MKTNLLGTIVTVDKDEGHYEIVGVYTERQGEGYRDAVCFVLLNQLQSTFYTVRADRCQLAGLTKPTRKARVVSGANSRDHVAQYLPINYTVNLCAHPATPGVDELIIEGVDDHGWTLDGYVIPRLASGLIVAEEIE